MFRSRRLTVFALGLALNLIWEPIHAVLFYKGLSEYHLVQFIALMLYAATVDGILIVMIDGIGAKIFLNKWKKYGATPLLFTIIAGVLIAAIIEEKALLLHQWEYTAAMPTVFGIGLSPLLQLATTGAFTFMIMKRMRHT